MPKSEMKNGRIDKNKKFKVLDIRSHIPNMELK